jgi:hypothetical protein
MIGQPLIIDGKAALFSQRLDPSVASVVRRISSQHTAFHTDFLVLGDYEENSSLVERLEAHKDALGDLWAVSRITISPSGLIKKTNIARGICFFDALYYCAQSQSVDLKIGKNIVTIDDPIWEAIPLFNTVAQSSGQPIDADGMPHPAVNP